jgi:hypothetical protein
MQTALIYSKFIHVNMVNLTPAGNLVDKAVRNYRHLMEEKHIQHASSPQKMIIQNKQFQKVKEIINLI